MLPIVILSLLALGGWACAAWLWQRQKLGRQDRAQQQQQHEVALRSLNEKLRTALDQLPFPVWQRDENLQLIDCNQTYAQLVGLSKAEALSQQHEIGAGVIADDGRELARRAAQLGHSQNESQYLVSDGHRRLYDFVEMPCPGGGQLGYALDVTALADTQENLERYVAASAQVLESLDNAIAILGSDTRLKFFNQAFADLFSLTPVYLRSDPPLAELLESMREARRLPEQTDFPGYKRDLVRRVMSVVRNFEELWHLPDGKAIRIKISPHPLGDVILSFDDVTDILTLEQSYNTLIEVQRESLNNLFESVAVIGSDGRLKLFNPAFAKLWGLPEDFLATQPHAADVMDRTEHILAHGGDWISFRNGIIAAIMSPQVFVARIERTDDRFIDFRSVPLPNGDFLASYIDVTDSVRVERALRERNDALEAADQLKSEFMANISYELRTPLNAIVGFAEILEHEFAGKLNDKQHDYSRSIVEAARQLTLLIDNALDFTTIEAGFMQLDRKPVDIRSLLRDVYELAQERTRGTSIQLELSVPADIDALQGDARRLKQALYSVITHTLKFTPPGGRIHIAAQPKNGDIEFRVTGTGMGIAHEPLHGSNKLVQGTRPDWTARSPFGLALVKSLIELHGGRVSVETATDDGTTITCHVPLRKPIATATAAKQ